MRINGGVNLPVGAIVGLYIQYRWIDLLSYVCSCKLNSNRIYVMYKLVNAVRNQLA